MSGGAMAEEEIEYESDPEDRQLTLKMRRREASDDEEDEGGEIREKPWRRIRDSDGESEGAPAEYEDEFEEEEEDYDVGDEYVEEIEEVHFEEIDVGRADDAVEMVVVRAEIREDGGATGELMAEKKGSNNDASQINSKNNNIVAGQREGEKKEIEPYAVPTAGAFYMHDDRFRENAGGRHRYYTFVLRFPIMQRVELNCRGV